MAGKDDDVYQAKLAEQAERYDDMVDHMKVVASSGSDLSVEERNLLSVAYKNVIGGKRASWRVLSSIIAKNESLGKDTSTEKEYQKVVEAELEEVCKEVIDLLELHLIKDDKKGESGGDDLSLVDSQVFYLKMKGDYHRYLAEYSCGEKKEKAKTNAEEAYKKAQDCAKSLPSTHPIKLGLALNFSVFHYEIGGDKQEACNLAKKAFDDAIAELDELKEDTYKDSTLIMQLLRDNLTLWTSNDDGDDPQNQGDGTQVEDIEVGGE